MRIPILLLLAAVLAPIQTSHGSSAPSAPGYIVCVSNERSDDVTLIDGAQGSVIRTLPAGKRPRGIHGSPDGKRLYVALSGSPILGPRHLRQGEQDDESPPPDRSADGIGIIDLQECKFIRKFDVGPDPEEFAVSADGTRIYVSNEDAAKMSVVHIDTGKIEKVVPVSEEPEGVALTPDGNFVYVTCETDGDIFVVNTRDHAIASKFTVGGRPRTVGFLPDGAKAFIPSENTGLLHVIDNRQFKPEKSIPLPTGSRPMGIAVTQDGRRIYVSTGWAGTVCVLDAQSLELLASVTVGSRPWGIALSPDDSLLYVANGPSHDISVVDAKELKEVKRIPAGRSPWGVAVVKAPAADEATVSSR